MFAAIESSAEQRTAIVNRASRRPQVHASTVGFGGKQKYRLARRLIGKGTVPILPDIVTGFGMQEEALIASATLRAAAAWHIGLND